MKTNRIGLLALTALSFGLASCNFTVGSPKSATSLGTSDNSLIAPGNGGDGNDSGSTSGVRISNLRECLLRESTPLYYEQQYNAIFAVHKFLDGETLRVATPSELKWTIAAVTQAQATSGYRTVLTHVNASSQKETGQFQRTTFAESSFATFPELRKSSIPLAISTERLAQIQAHAASMVDPATGQPNGAVLLVIHGEGRVLATNMTVPAPVGSGPSSTMADGGAHQFQISMRLISGLNNCEGTDLPPDMAEMCEEECDVYDSPLVLDLKGDGIRSTTLENGVRFDIDANGTPNQVAWISGSRNADWDDAFLARDINRNGMIDNGSELFGQATRLGDGQLPVNGFVALKALDSNGDNSFDSRDSRFRELVLWQDKNKNGISERAEIIPLSQKVQSIDLRFQATNMVDSNGNKVLAVSTFKDLSGRVKDIIDIFFQVVRDE